MVLRPSVQPPTELKSPQRWAVKPLANALKRAQESSVPLVVKPVPLILKASRPWPIPVWIEGNGIF